MGVLNVTPDSFSDGGRHDSLQRAVARVEEMVAHGADVVDVGGESTRPGASPVDPRIEQRRVLPVLEAVADTCAGAGVRLSIDTRHAATAVAAVGAGATLVNDVSASLWGTAGELGVGWVAMHMLGDPRTMQAEPRYDDVVADVFGFLRERVATAIGAGVDEVWVDPGIGFGKTTAHNLALLGHLDELVADGIPVVVGTSRKRFLGELLARSDAGLRGIRDLGDGQATGDPGPVPVGERLAGSLSTATWAMILGARMVRVHDVAATVRAVDVAMAAAGVRARTPAAPDGRPAWQDQDRCEGSRTEEV